jgi:hypothetical protein
MRSSLAISISTKRSMRGSFTTALGQDSVAFRYLRGFSMVKANTFRSCGLNLFCSRFTYSCNGFGVCNAMIFCYLLLNVPS